MPAFKGCGAGMFSDKKDEHNDNAGGDVTIDNDDETTQGGDAQNAGAC